MAIGQIGKKRWLITSSDDVDDDWRMT